jgi:hypothetical protein
MPDASRQAIDLLLRQAFRDENVAENLPSLTHADP